MHDAPSIDWLPYYNTLIDRVLSTIFRRICDSDTGEGIGGFCAATRKYPAFGCSHFPFSVGNRRSVLAPFRLIRSRLLFMLICSDDIPAAHQSLALPVWLSLSIRRRTGELLRIKFFVGKPFPSGKTILPVLLYTSLQAFRN